MFAVILSLFLGLSSNAKTVLVSDIDDTIKISHILDLQDAAAYAIDSDSEFLGMSALYQSLQNENPEMKFYYLSNAPEFLLSGTHTDFLKNKRFPKGKYLPRTNLLSSNHKISSLRKIIQNENPDTLILIGDNGEKDILVYNQIALENANSNLKIIQLIHNVYSTNNQAEEKGLKTMKDQIGFVTSVEAALELNQLGLLSTPQTKKIINYVASILVNEPNNKFYGDLAFPYFLKCDRFNWPWNFEVSAELRSIQEKTFLLCTDK